MPAGLGNLENVILPALEGQPQCGVEGLGSTLTIHVHISLVPWPPENLSVLTGQQENPTDAPTSPG